MNERKVKEIIFKVKDKTLNLKGDMEKVFRIRDAHDRKVFYFLIIIAFLILIYVFFIRGYFSDQKDKKITLEKIKTEQIRQERIEKIEKAPKSITSFFLTETTSAKLSIPDYWEGNYRLKEIGRQASFLYIEDPNNITEIIYIRLVSLEEQLKDGEKEISEDNRIEKEDGIYTFVYKLAEENPYADQEKLRVNFDRMRIDAREMIKKYFKTF